MKLYVHLNWQAPATKAYYTHNAMSYFSLPFCSFSNVVKWSIIYSIALAWANPPLVSMYAARSEQEIWLLRSRQTKSMTKEKIVINALVFVSALVFYVSILFVLSFSRLISILLFDNCETQRSNLLILNQRKLPSMWRCLRLCCPQCFTWKDASVSEPYIWVTERT